MCIACLSRVIWTIPYLPQREGLEPITTRGIKLISNENSRVSADSTQVNAYECQGREEGMRERMEGRGWFLGSVLSPASSLTWASVLI